MNINTLEMEWTDTGCVANAIGLDGIMLTCPRCQAPLPRGQEHRCGDKATPRKPATFAKVKAAHKRKEQP